MRMTKKQLIKQLRITRGLISPIAKTYGISRQAIHKRIKSDPQLQEAFEDSRELLKDEAEHALATAVHKKERWAVEKVIDKMCHDRGYVDKQEINKTVKQDEEQFKKSQAADSANIKMVIKSIRKTLNPDG